ncbi:MAG: hypothetical protein A2Y33_13230 [Spirochaetes bacterium GWF1_51_8]|nr:MAG: hypothetical protein A2Y33_13230 [Spirochaetes bacterium GWF1_51_8]
MARSGRDFICISCPRGCEISTVLDGKSIVSIEGNVCALGRKYVEGELNDPRRVMTSTVAVRGGRRVLVPVWTDKPVPKDAVMKIAGELRKIVLDAPVKCGKTVIINVSGTDANIVTSGEVEAR